MKRVDHCIFKSVALIGLTMCPLLVAQESAGLVSADGFVTQKTGSGLQIGTLNVQLNEQTRCFKFDDVYATQELDLKVRQLSTPCASLALNVGTYIHLVGTRQSGGSLAAITLETSDPWRVVEANPPARKSPSRIPWFRVMNSLSGGPLRGKLAGGSFLEDPPAEVLQGKNGGNARLWVGGFPLEATKATAMILALGDIDRKSMVRFGTNNFGDVTIFHRPPKHLALAFPAADRLLPGIYLAYKGTQEADGHIVASNFIIFPHATESAMRNLNIAEPQITEPDYEARSSGSIRYRYGSAIQIVPDLNIQEYVQRVGMDLIPNYQKATGGKDTQNPNFRFYVVHPFDNDPRNGFVQMDGRIPKISSADWKGLHSPFVLPVDHARVDRIVEMPDGVILIPDTSLARLRDESQLAFALSIAVQSVVQRQEYIAVGAMGQFYRYGGYGVSPMWISCTETMLGLRLGIRQMYLAGYDIREAPFVWKYERGQQVENPVINSTQPDSDFPWYAAYAFNYISQYYRDVDYSKLKRGEKEYQQFLQELRKADPEAFAAQARK